MAAKSSEPMQPTLAQLHLIARHWKRLKPFSSLATDIDVRAKSGRHEHHSCNYGTTRAPRYCQSTSRSASLTPKSGRSFYTDQGRTASATANKSAAAEEEIKETNNGAGERTHPEKACTRHHQTSPNVESTRNTWCQDLETDIRTMKRQLERTCSATRALSVTSDRNAIYYRCSSMKSVITEMTSQVVDEVITFCLFQGVFCHCWM